MAREKQTDRKAVQKTIYISEDSAAAMKELAEKEGVSVNTVASRLLQKTLSDTTSTSNGPMILVFANFKGGVGKTICAGNLAAMLALKGHKVLSIDLDGQGDLSKYFDMYNPTPEAPCILDVMVSQDDGSRKPLADVIVKTKYENLDLVPSSLRFNGGEGKMRNEIGAVSIDTRLKNAITDLLETGADYEYIIIDCSPTLDLVVTNALIALEAGNDSSMLILPVKLEGFALSGANETVEMTERICRERRVRRSSYRILRTVAERKTNVYEAANKLVINQYGPEKTLSTIISKNTKINESTLTMRPAVIEAEETAKEYIEFESLAQEIEDLNHGH